MLKETLTCSPNKNMSIYFKNGEEGYEQAQWVYDNIKYCTDASAIYIHGIRNEIMFY